MASTFLRDYRTVGRQTQRLERMLAVGRAFLAVSATAAIYIDPTEPARFAALTYGLLAAYGVYSLIVLEAVRRSTRLTARVGLILHAVDLLWASVLTFFSEGPVSPLFLFFLFVLLAAAYRWGFRETLATALVAVLVVLFQTALVAAGPWRQTLFTNLDLRWTPVVIRMAYLLLTGFLLGYLAEQEKQFRAEIAATADAMRQPRVELGMGGSVGAIGRLMQRMFDALAADVVVQDQETGRTMLWHFDRDADARPVEGLELDEPHRSAWLFEMPARVWYGAGSLRQNALSATALDSEPGAIGPVEVRLPSSVIDMREFRTLAAVDFGLAGQWHGRVYLFDPLNMDAGEPRLQFLASLTDHVAAVFSNVFLLQRLRQQAGAAERARVARELHDGAIQALIGIEMQVEALRRRAEHDPPAVAAELVHIQNLVRQEVIALRELMQELRPVDLDAPYQLPDALAALVERFRRDTGVSARFVSTVKRSVLPMRTAIEIIRIVQEALVNVRKHSRARNVLVQLDEQDGGWRLLVEDDGRGFEFEGRLSGADLDTRRLGPTVIKERARVIGGEVTIESLPDTGARVEVTFHAV